MKTAIPTILFLAITWLPARGDGVDDYIDAHMKQKHVPGLSLAVVRDGRIVKAHGYGLANVETGTTATPETVYKIASISKQFLAAGILLLERDGRLVLDDPVARYLDDTPAAWSGITIRHLLTHTSGLVEDPPGFEPFQARPDADIVRSAYATKLLFAPGERLSYSNLGYFVLGEVIRKVAGRPYGEFLAARLFAPAGMVATRTTTTTEIVPRRASGYSWDGRGLKKAEDWVAVRPSGAFLSTVLDLARWDAALDAESPLPASTRERMWVPVRLKDGSTRPYGFGWSVDPWQGHRRVHHNGGLPGFLSDFERFPDDRLTVVVMINSTSADPEKIALNVAGLYVPSLAPPILKPIPDHEPEITAKVKALLDGLVGDRLDTAVFVPKLHPWLEGGGRAGMAKAFREPGSMRSVELVDRKDEGHERVLRYRVSYPHDSRIATFHFDESGRVCSMGVEAE